MLTIFWATQIVYLCWLFCCCCFSHSIFSNYHIYIFKANFKSYTFQNHWWNLNKRQTEEANNVFKIANNYFTWNKTQTLISLQTSLKQGKTKNLHNIDHKKCHQTHFFLTQLEYVVFKNISKCLIFNLQCLPLKLIRTNSKSQNSILFSRINNLWVKNHNLFWNNWWFWGDIY